AAVSVLSITKANNIYEMARIKPVTQMEDGYLYVEIPLSIPEKQGVLAQTLLEAFANSMKAVEKSYGQYITLKFENGGQ
ncbi:MAG TPA: ribosomal-processing cysteine protease Prp, partial [Lactococcus lactis]|nr:ribosomal-processing cysteine protease Prp [Lactococcus lactis]